MVRINLVAAAEASRLLEHEQRILSTPAKRLGAAARLTDAGRMLLLTRVRVEGWPVARAARAAGITRAGAYALLARCPR